MPFIFTPHFKIEFSLSLPCDTSLEIVNLNKELIAIIFLSFFFYYLQNLLMNSFIIKASLL